MNTITLSPTRPRARRWPRVLLWALGVLAVLMGVAYLVVSGIVATRLMTPQRLPITRTPADVGLAFDEVRIPSRDGVEIAGWFIPREGAERALLLVHGVNSNRSTEFQGRFVDFARDMHEAGFAVLMMDMRGHGASSGRYFSLGDQERWDIAAAAAWLAAQGWERIGLVGVSMGGASSAEATVVSDHIDAAVLDSVYPDLQRLLSREFPKRASLPAWFLPGATLMGRVLVGADLGAVSPAAHTGPDATPLLVMYGTEDDLIPDDEFGFFGQANPDAETWVAPGGQHAALYRDFRDEYLRRVLAFFDEHLR